MSVPQIRSVCVFCGAAVGNHPAYGETARDLGRRLAGNGIRLVFGAGHVGMMGTIADAVLEAGGEAVGVIPDFLRDRELAHEHLTELHVVDSMHTRKRMMFDLCDAFIVLPGGIGTLEETFEMITWRQLGRHEKPIVLISTRDYWAPFKAMIDRMVDDDFAHGDPWAFFDVVPDPEAAIALLTNRP